jgi:DNA-binding NarL/FixJ family response regulator
MGSHRVLMVDDNRLFLEAAIEFLVEQNSIGEIVTAQSGQDALMAISMTHPDLLIVDLAMPGMGGLELTRLVKERWPEIPVIILTLHDSAHHRRAALEAGADAFVPKTLIDSELLATVSRLLVV